MAFMKKLKFYLTGKKQIGGVEDKKKFEKLEHTVIVKTGDTAKAGTDADVFLQLIGADRETQPTKLDKLFRDDFERGKTDIFIVNMKQVGKPLLCKLIIKDKGIWPDWYIEYIQVFVGDIEYFFSVYQWVQDGFTTTEGKAVLPSNLEHKILKEYRTEYLKKQHRTYRWRADPEVGDLTYGLNGHLQAKQHKDLPRNAQWSAERDHEFHHLRETGLKNLMLNKFLGVFRKFDNLDEVKKLLLLPSMKSRRVLEPCWYKWREDAEFAREQINGSRPRGVKRVNNSLPKTFNVTDEDIKDLLPPGCTIRTETQKGRIFIIDNSIMDGIICGLHPILKTQNYSCSPYLLLHCDEGGYLTPLAIQLHASRPRNENPVWTPNDAAEEWLLAKMFFNNANGQIQQLNEHLLFTHMVTEPFAVALRRQVSRNHPLFRHLFPHIQHTIAVNSYARGVMISPGGTIDRLMTCGGGGHLELLRRGFRKFNLSFLDLPEQLKERGMDDPNMIKEYGYREDGMKYWKVISKYVGGILDIFYTSDEVIRADYELQNWIGDVKRHGFNFAEDAEIPDVINTVPQLQLLLTKIIFASSVQHAADGNPMFDIYGNPPNHPVLMRLPTPTQKGDITLERIMSTLPDQDLMCAQMAVSFTLSNPPADEVFLGEFPMKLFTNPKPLAVLEQFTKDVSQIGEEIRERNKTWSVPYDYLLPEKIPCRIDM